MQSSFRVIKNSSVVSQETKEIVTEFLPKVEIEQKELAETNAKDFIESYESLAKNMVQNARKQADDIMSKAYEDIEQMKKEAYEMALREGFDKGYKEAYEEGYEKNVAIALNEAEIIKNNADNILKCCIEEKEKYIVEKEEEFKSLIVNTVESILKREVKDKDGLNEIIFEALSQVKNTKAFIIKCRSIYCEELKNNIDKWKEQLPFRGDIFIIPDDSIKEGSVLIERDSGKIVISIDIALEKLKEMLYNQE